jgi:hypothetical protein
MRWIESTSVYTNNPPCGAMRALGAVQTRFAAEAQMDKLAAALRHRPGRAAPAQRDRPGDQFRTGQPITGSLPVTNVIKRCLAL